MADLTRLRLKRGTVRTKVTKNIKAAEKLMTEDVKSVRVKELQSRLETLKLVIQEHEEAHEAYAEQMAAEGKPEDEIQTEADANSTVELGFEDAVDKITERVNMHSLFLSYEEAITTAEVWLSDSTPAAAEFLTNGKKQQKDLEQFIRDSAPYATHTFFQPLVTKAKATLTQVKTVLFKAPTPTVTAAVPAAVVPKTQGPYNVEAPSFSGKPRDFHPFYTRFTSVIDIYKDSYSDGDLCNILAKAMEDREARRLVERYSPTGYEEAMKQLKSRYGRAAAVYPQLVEELVTRNRYDYSQESMHQIQERTQLVLTSMETVNGKSIEQLAVALVVRDFDAELEKEWVKHLGDEDKLPNTDVLLQFIEPLSHNLSRKKKSLSAQAAPFWPAAPRSVPDQQQNEPAKKNEIKTSPVTTVPSKLNCLVCKGKNHPLYQCQQFKDATVQQRWNLIRQHKYCANCLHRSHTVGSCASTYVCKHCKAKHNTLLHKEEEDKKSAATVLVTPALIDIAAKSANEISIRPKCGFINTALVSIHWMGKRLTVRAAMDNCSSHTIVTEKVASYLKPSRQPIDMIMRGTVSEVKLKHSATIAISTVYPSDFNVLLGAAIAPALPPSTPPADKSKIATHPVLSGLQLADSDFGGELDLIIGTSDLPLFWGMEAKKFSVEDRITAVSTVFGWTVTGPLPDSSAITALKVELTKDEELAEAFNTLYELDQVPQVSPLTADEHSAISQFNEYITQDNDGHYRSGLPRVKDPPPLGKSEKMAKSRLLANERRMKAAGKLKEFDSEMYGYLILNHAEEVPADKLNAGKYFLPVKGVIKSDSTTTKVRPVFDASARTSSGHSFNDQLLVGPNLYPLITDVLLRFRLHSIAYTADISKMYREIRLLDKDKDYHRLFIRSPTGQLLHCQMNRLTFGVRPAPFIATSVLRFHANKHKEEFPEACSAIEQDFYVDDFLSGCDDVEQAIKIRTSLCSLLSMGGMKLRKWRSNSKELLQTIPGDLIEQADRRQLSASSSLKTLGVHWDVVQDCLYIATPKAVKQENITKRWIAKVVAKLYDILGLLSPFLIAGKIILQELWARKIGWDQTIPADLLQRWKQWTDELKLVQDHPIRRHTGKDSSVVSSTLHGFSDASEVAFGAVIYLRHHHQDNSASTALVFSKAKVTPLKKRTIPQLELEAAKLLAQLLSHVASVLQLPFTSVQPWTDYSIVLAWLKQPIHKLKTFVANCVAMITELLPGVEWKHVPTASNPADLASRSSSASALLQNDLWWHGPPWLGCSETEWPSTVGVGTSLLRELPDMKATVLVTVTETSIVSDWDFWGKYSSYTTLIRITAWILRFTNCCLHRRPKPTGDKLTFSELSEARLFLIIRQQKTSYPEIFTCLKRKKQLPVNHSLAGLAVNIVDDALKVSGRVRDSATRTPRQMFPLSLKSRLTRLLVETEHRRQLHPGVATLLTTIGHTYYITGLKTYLKKLSRSCPQCQQANAVPLQQRLGLLPTARTSVAPPFLRTGIDFAGPLTLREGSTRKPVFYKSYICVFVCMATRALHFEVCRSLDTQEFVATFRRFCNRRGTPAEIFTDNGSNFLGAANEIKDIKRMIHTSKKSLSHLTAEQEVHWHFNPPRAPHFGGLWEAGVKSMKRQLKKLVAPHPLRLDEMQAVLLEVEAILNSRPLTAADQVEAEDELVLTPAHFLIYRPLKAPPTQPASQAKISTLTRWNLVQRLQQDFTESWKSCYLQSLQARSKWKRSHSNVKVGDLVYIKDITLAKGHRWPLGKIVAVFPGQDELVRTVDVLSNSKIYRRAIHLLIPLQLEEAPAAKSDDRETTQADTVDIQGRD